mgnify:CR=1 FL=1
MVVDENSGRDDGAHRNGEQAQSGFHVSSSLIVDALSDGRGPPLLETSCFGRWGAGHRDREMAVLAPRKADLRTVGDGPLAALISIELSDRLTEVHRWNFWILLALIFIIFVPLIAMLPSLMVSGKPRGPRNAPTNYRSI